LPSIVFIVTSITAAGNGIEGSGPPAVAGGATAALALLPGASALLTGAVELVGG
jgi:hypothetical protein